jgi:hypothetical protein
MIDYDEYGVFTLADAQLQAVAGGDTRIRIGPFVRVRGAEPVPQRTVTLPTILGVYVDAGCTALNVLCTEGTDGINPVCFTNVGC